MDTPPRSPATEVTRGVAEAYGGYAESGDVAGRIEAVFVREAGLRVTEVMITAVGDKVILSGQVHSWRERDLAERIAWATPGVTEVMDRIKVQWRSPPASVPRWKVAENASARRRSAQGRRVRNHHRDRSRRSQCNRTRLSPAMCPGIALV
jgi:hypothetical protein